MRKIKRSIAQTNMKLAGHAHVNRPGVGGKSFFARNWRTFVY